MDEKTSESDSAISPMAFQRIRTKIFSNSRPKGLNFDMRINKTLSTNDKLKNSNNNTSYNYEDVISELFDSDNYTDSELPDTSKKMIYDSSHLYQSENDENSSKREKELKSKQINDLFENPPIYDHPPMEFEYKVSNLGNKLIDRVLLYNHLDFYPKFIKRQQERERIYKEMKSPFETPYLNLTNQQIKISVK